MSAYQQAVRLNPNFYLTWYNQARCYALQGQKDQTLASLHRAIQLNPETVQSLAQNESDFSELYQEEQFQHLLCNSAKP
ncbi:MAG: tetratricopeptide repeat protein [Oscillatoriales cyanobacterium RM1_1_9]|nr:tetratricopeptide repeat protein [Oscillatoriales cyanobacterium SM2_3_0]NJO47912.1 tetratricopeptide repeat protein [Oscillatoriales cyanobacterium RM2_1_1]NJO71437.1 tetratricopeptide repeat protein [Oscillatoriales cyanobacterium RM1_1_9]